MTRLAVFASMIFILVPAVCAQDTVHKALLRDIVSIEGIRHNPVLGYGMVVGLKGTGDSQQTIFTTHTLANVLQHMGVQIPTATVTVKNVAAVFVTARSE